jgi:hypothetical protein
MHDQDADELITFRNVAVVRATSTALFCSIEGRAVWLPRGLAHGKLRQKGDRGTLRIRRSAAAARDLVPPLASTLDTEIPGSRRPGGATDL